MKQVFYTAERAQQILIQLLKEHGIKRIIASPGTTNLTFVASVQGDSFFEIYSSVDERSAAYMACGMAAETGEPVVITCTGATASRNYMPGLTEAYYSKLPVLAVTANSGVQNKGHLIAQQLDRSSQPVDVARMSVDIPVVKDDTDAWLANVNINKAILALSHNGGGPAHINISTTYCKDFSVRELPAQRVINRISAFGKFPPIEGKIAIFVGRHKPFSKKETELVERFCESHDAVVFGDHSSEYYGRYFVSYSAVLMQRMPTDTRNMDILIHIGEVSGDYPSMGLRPKAVWRVSPDGEIKDTFHKLRYVFEMPEEVFFKNYGGCGHAGKTDYYRQCMEEYRNVESLIPELPFGNIWIARHLSVGMPAGSEVHLGILNTLRSWNLFQTSADVTFRCNVGGFGIDGIMSTTLGASLINPSKLYFCIIGDLAFFYDLNSIANRHVSDNLRILLINNGRGTEFTNFGHLGHMLGADADSFVAAAGHYGKKSKSLVRHFAEDLGFEYLSASDKRTFKDKCGRFLAPLSETPAPLLFEVFMESGDESDALETMYNILVPEPSQKRKIVEAVKSVVGESAVGVIKKVVGKK